MLGVIVNAVAVILGGFAGVLFKKGIPERLNHAIMTGVGLCVLYIGIDGALEGDNTLVLILSLVFGAAVGTVLDIDRWIGKLGAALENRFRRADGKISVTEGFVTASLLFCVGAMAVVGSLNAGLLGDNEILFTKSLLDMISACVLAVSLGVGVLFSAAAVFVYQGALVLLSQLVAPVLNAAAIAELTCTGSVLIMALGLNMIGITKIKVANFMPAVVFAPVFTWLFTFISS